MSNRLNAHDIFAALTSFRNDLRTGVVTVSYRTDPQALRFAAATALSLKDSDEFNTNNFNPQTLKRFANLFDVPFDINEEDRTTDWPTQDETATAVQNFLNRRFNPWSHVTGEPVSATEADPLSSLVLDNG